MSLLARRNKPRDDAPPDRTGHKITWVENMVARVVAVVVSTIVLVSLVISITSIQEKIRLSNGLTQVIGLVSDGRNAWEANPRMGEEQPEDFIAMRAKAESATTTVNVNGMMALTNPWRGKMFAYVFAGGVMRIETYVPPRACRRMIDALLEENPRELGIEQIDVRDTGGIVKIVYRNRTMVEQANAIIEQACQNPMQAGVGLTFDLRRSQKRR